MQGKEESHNIENINGKVTEPEKSSSNHIAGGDGKQNDTQGKKF